MLAQTLAGDLVRPKRDSTIVHGGIAMGGWTESSSVDLKMVVGACAAADPNQI